MWISYLVWTQAHRNYNMHQHWKGKVRETIEIWTASAENKVIIAGCECIRTLLIGLRT